MTNLLKAKSLLAKGDFLSSLEFFEKSSTENIYSEDEKKEIFYKIYELSLSLNILDGRKNLDFLVKKFNEYKDYKKSHDLFELIVDKSKKYKLFELEINNIFHLGKLKELEILFEDYLNYLIKNKNIAKALSELEKNNYSINELRQKIKLNNIKIQNLQKIKNYHNNNIQYSKAFQQTLKNDLMIDTINLQIQIDIQKIDQFYAKLTELVNTKVDKVENECIS